MPLPAPNIGSDASPTMPVDLGDWACGYGWTLRVGAKRIRCVCADREEETMELGIEGKVALVTGGSHGIGRAIAEELGRNSCRVLIVARGQAGIDEAVAAIRAEGGEAAGFSADLEIGRASCRERVCQYG